MRTTITFDDELMTRTQEMSGLTECVKLIRETLVAPVQRERARCLIWLGWNDAQLQPVSRSRNASA